MSALTKHKKLFSYAKTSGFDECFNAIIEKNRECYSIVTKAHNNKNEKKTIKKYELYKHEITYHYAFKETEIVYESEWLNESIKNEIEEKINAYLNNGYVVFIGRPSIDKIIKGDYLINTNH